MVNLDQIVKIAVLMAIALFTTGLGGTFLDESAKSIIDIVNPFSEGKPRLTSFDASLIDANNFHVSYGLINIEKVTEVTVEHHHSKNGDFSKTQPKGEFTIIL